MKTFFLIVSMLSFGILALAQFSKGYTNEERLIWGALAAIFTMILIVDIKIDELKKKIK